MIKSEDVYRIGIINKPHGVHGELLFTFDDDIFDRVESEYIVCLMDGIMVPFFFEEYRFRSDTTALIKLEGIDTEIQARRMTNIEVYFPKKLAEKIEDDELTWQFFIGFTIIDINKNKIGKITDVDESTINVLFVVEHDGTELLIPAQEDFITVIDRDKKIIYMNLPEGLLELGNT
ncbi:MAG: ribosome maturation factor RimM [Bacteroidaceae bacterium]|nr:ribosome maturation factor RimM [Bacteroidaceae bacterium]